MITATGFFTGAGGGRIFWQSWKPDGDVRAVIVLAHGASEHSGRYGYVAEVLVADGYAVHALDHRGHGRSSGPRAVIDRLSNAVADLDQLVLEAREQHPGAPVYLLGHSMGGTVAVSYALHHQPDEPRLAGLIYESDPLNHHGKLPARTVAELTVAINRFPQAVGAITVPTLILYGTADRLCPPAGSTMLGERIGASDKTVKSYPGLFHEILNEPERDEVLTDIRGWLAERLANGSDRRRPDASPACASSS